MSIALSAAVMAIGVYVNYVSPDEAFIYITSVATIGIIFVWGAVLVSHMVYRRRVAAGALPASDYRLPGAPYTTVTALGFLVLVVVLLFFTDDGRSAIVVVEVPEPPFPPFAEGPPALPPPCFFARPSAPRTSGAMRSWTASCCRRSPLGDGTLWDRARSWGGRTRLCAS